MSKAFTSEETPEPGPVVRAPPRLAPGEVRWVTPEGHAALRAEHARLLAAGDPRAVTAAATLALLTPRSPEEAPPGEAGFGAWVTVEDGGGARRTWRLVGPDETDARRGLVSVHAPLGRALLGRRAGEVATVARPGGEIELAVVAVHRHDPGA